MKFFKKSIKNEKFSFTFHTGFIERNNLVLDKSELDCWNENDKMEFLNNDFRVELKFKD